MQKKALILVDLQNEFINKKSGYYLGDLKDLINRTNQLIELCRNQDYKIIFTQHVELNSEIEFKQGSSGVELISSLARHEDDVVIIKNKISPFYKTTLNKELKNISEIVIAGVLTNLCVRSLSQDAYDRDYEIKIIADCCQALDKKTHEFTLQDLKATREDIEIMDLKEFILQ